MGFKPQAMTPLSFPSEWLLTIFDGKQRPRTRPYVFVIETPPMPWMLQELIPGLQNGWSCMLVTAALGVLIAYLL